MTRTPPLDGLLVVDFTRVLAGPLCTMVLADLGARVVKIERPETGDDTRSWKPPAVAGDATYFLSVNRDKESMVIDLASPGGRTSALELMRRADIVVENFRAGVMDRLGLGYHDVKAENAAIVYCSIPAFAGAPEAKPGYDLLMQAATGLMSLTGTEVPTKTGVALLDVVAGLYAATGILSAVHERAASGRGQKVTVGLYEASLAALVNQSAAYLMAGQVSGPVGNAHPSIVPYQAFRARDRSFVLAAGNDKLFRDTVEVLSLEWLVDDSRFRTNASRVQHREMLVKILEERFAAEDAKYWVRELEARGVPASLVRSLDEVFEAPESQSALAQVWDAARGPLRYVRTPIELSDSPARPPRRPPPRLGAHTHDLLVELAASRPSKDKETPQ